MRQTHSTFSSLIVEFWTVHRTRQHIVIIGQSKNRIDRLHMLAAIDCHSTSSHSAFRFLAVSYFHRLCVSPASEFPAGEEVVALLGLTNTGDRTYNLSYIGAHLHSAYDFSFFIQNVCPENYASSRNLPSLLVSNFLSSIIYLD